jgi:protein-S-isoprenylcysteine O-methyltransferase Ste14
LWLTAKRDEAECLQQFGEAYRDYMQRSRMFIPWVF